MTRKIKATKEEFGMYVGGDNKQIVEIADDLVKVREGKIDGETCYRFEEPIVVCGNATKVHSGKKKIVLLEDLGPTERILKLSGKSGKRAEICKILITKGEISRDDVKKGENPLNKWGDVRFLLDDGIIEEIQREGDIIYILSEDVKKGLKSIKR
jgi:hypothetical protein